MSLTIDSVARISMDRLAALVVEHAAQDELLARKLELAVAAATPDISVLIEQLRNDIALTREDDSFYGYYQAGELADDLEATRLSIVEDLLPRDARAAADLLAAFVRLDSHVMEHCDDSDGRVGMVIQEAVEDLGRAWAAVPDRAPEEVATLVLDLCRDNDYGVHDRVITAFQDALGAEGLHVIEQKVREQLGALSSASIGVGEHVGDVGDVGDGDDGDELEDDELDDDGSDDEPVACVGADAPRGLPLSRATLFGLLEEIADARGDVDGYIAAHQQAGTVDHHIRDIVERLLRVDRCQEALEWVVQAGEAPRGRDLSDLHITVLERLQRPQEAQEIRWRVYARTLGMEALNAFLSRVEGEDRRQAAIGRAVAMAQNYSSRHAALRVLAAFAPAAAEDYVIAHQARLNGDLYGTLRPIAEQLADAHPLASVLLYRALTGAVLERKASQQYQHAVRDLLAGDQLTATVSDWRGQPTQAEYREALGVEHKRKRNFWALLQEASAERSELRPR